MSDDPAETRRRAGKRLLGGVLMAGGGMIALLCGLCTLAASVATIAAVFQSGPTGVAALGTLAIILPIGGLPTAVGAVVFWIGLRMFREGRAPLGKPWKEFE